MCHRDVTGVLAHAAPAPHALKPLAFQADALREPDHMLTPAEVARRCAVSERTVYRALRSGALAGVKLGTVWRVHPAALERWTMPRPATKPSALHW